MLDRGVIEASNSPWSFRTVLIAKKDGSTRVCVDYRALKEVIINKDAYPLPRVDDCLDSPVLLRTDNAAVSWLQSLKDPTGQVARWLQTLGTYNFKVTHRAGRKHTNADAMSRNPCKSCKHQEDLNQAESFQAREVSDHPVECLSNLEKQKETVEHLVTPLTEADETPDIKNAEITELIPEMIRAVTRSELKEQQNAMKDNEALLGEDEDIGKIFAAFESGPQKPPWGSISSGTSALKTLWGQWDRLEMHGGVLYRRFETNIGQAARKQMIVPKSRTQELLHYFHDVPSAAHLGVDKTLEKLKNGCYWPNMKEYVQVYCRSCDSCFARKPKKESTKTPLGTYISGEPMERVALDIFVPLPLTKRSNKYILVISDLFTKWTEAIALPNQESLSICTAFIDHFVTKFGAPLQLHSDQGRNFQADIFQRMCKLLGIHKTRTTSFRPQSNGGVERFNRTLASMLSMYCKQNQDQWDQYLQQVMMAYRSSVHASTSRTPNSMLFGRGGEAVWIYDPIRKKGVCSKLTPKWKGPFIIEKRIDDVTYRVKRSLRQPSTVYHVDRLALYQGRNVPSWASRFRRMMDLEEANNDQQLDKPVG
ncbi:unnamed protein product [Mytilus coruscus]|uniref:Integrase catalytic domain-containing protein n=1 Tax=Mytilus coruscus TaxID=42192 RepID=A0A6J8ESR9_MYTCO|nr:unnamed protein product [Mytilus coruscus]